MQQVYNMLTMVLPLRGRLFIWNEVTIVPDNIQNRATNDVYKGSNYLNLQLFDHLCQNVLFVCKYQLNMNQSQI